MTLNLLLLEDDPELARVITQAFSGSGYAIDLCLTGADAIRQGTLRAYMLLVLDWTDGDVLETCGELRRQGVSSPILILSTRGEVAQRVLALDAGADDYMTKPFETDELLARARALVRRTSRAGRMRCGDLELDPLARRATIDERTLGLTDREFGLLYRLIEDAEKVVSRSELLAHLRDVPESSSNVVEVHVSRLRQKLGAHKWMIETVRGRGYKLRAQPAKAAP